MSMSKRRRIQGESEEIVDNPLQVSEFQIELVKILDVEELIFHLPISSDMEENERKWNELYDEKKYKEIVEILDFQLEFYKEKKIRIQSHCLRKCMKGVTRAKLCSLYRKYVTKDERHSPSNLSTPSLISELVLSFLNQQTQFDKQVREEENIDDLSGDSLEEICSGIEFVEVCGKIIPIELTSRILSYLHRNYSVIVNIGGVCKLFYIIIISTWNNSNVSNKNIHSYSLLALRSSKSITIRQNCQVREINSVWLKLSDRSKVQILEIDRYPISRTLKTIIDNNRILKTLTTLSSFHGFETLKGINSFQLRKHFPNLTCFKGCSRKDDKALRSIIFDDEKSNKRTKITKLEFMSPIFFRIPSTEMSIGCRYYLGYIKDDLSHSSGNNSAWVYSDFPFSNVTSLSFDEIRKLYHPVTKEYQEEEDSDEEDLVFDDTYMSRLIRRSNISAISWKTVKNVILDIFSVTVRDIKLDIYGGFCHCDDEDKNKRVIFFFMERLPNLENVIIRSFPGVHESENNLFSFTPNLSSKPGVHFCNEIEYKCRSEDEVRKKLNRFVLESNCDLSEFKAPKFCEGDIPTGLIDFNLEDMLSRQFFENFSMLHFRAIVPFSKGRDIPSKIQRIRARKNMGRERAKECKKIMKGLAKLVTDGVIMSQFETFDLKIVTRDEKEFKKESIRLKYYNPGKVLHVLYTRREGSGRNEFDIFRNKHVDLENRIRNSKRPLQCFFQMFVSSKDEVMKKMVKKELVDLFVYSCYGNQMKDNVQEEIQNMKRSDEEGVFDGYRYKSQNDEELSFGRFC